MRECAIYSPDLDCVLVLRGTGVTDREPGLRTGYYLDHQLRANLIALSRPYSHTIFKVSTGISVDQSLESLGTVCHAQLALLSPANDSLLVLEPSRHGSRCGQPDPEALNSFCSVARLELCHQLVYIT